jgi:hypothetical protein
MPELLISEITRMAEGFCVIGLARGPNGLYSLRPLPRTGFAWQPFPYRRADRVSFDLQMVPLAGPHFEDRQTVSHSKSGVVSEADLVAALKQAEVADSAAQLFACNLMPSTHGGPASCVRPADARRSICGCSIANIRFSFGFYPARHVRVTLRLESGDRLDSLPVVDHDWLRFIDFLWTRSQGEANLSQRLQTYFNRWIRDHILSSTSPFARIGLTRPDKTGVSWLMLDSVFPQPRMKWLEEFS